jgi:UDPglucose--hexose-1-phosphate uridylyltransferase
MGLAVLPARLNTEMELLRKCLSEKLPLSTYEELEKHRAWAEEFVPRHPELNADNAEAIIQEEIGRVFVGVLEDAGVYKCTPEDREAFDRFIQIL